MWQELLVSTVKIPTATRFAQYLFISRMHVSKFKKLHSVIVLVIVQSVIKGNLMKYKRTTIARLKHCIQTKSHHPSNDLKNLIQTDCLTSAKWNRTEEKIGDLSVTFLASLLEYLTASSVCFLLETSDHKQGKK